MDIGTKLAQTTGGGAEAAFRQVYKSVTFQWVDGVCGGSKDRCYADAYSFPTIKFYSKWHGTDTDILATPDIAPNLVIHESGHGFDSRTGLQFRQDATNRGITDKTGFGVAVGAKGQAEVTADLFLNYILGTFTGSGTNGVDLPGFMDTNIANWINIASTP